MSKVHCKWSKSVIPTINVRAKRATCSNHLLHILLWDPAWHNGGKIVQHLLSVYYMSGAVLSSLDIFFLILIATVNLKVPFSGFYREQDRHTGNWNNFSITMWIVNGWAGILAKLCGGYAVISGKTQTRVLPLSDVWLWAVHFLSPDHPSLLCKMKGLH